MPYLRNAWYAAAYSGEVGDAPLSRVLLDEPIVFFRDGEGRAVGLQDRCPHRFVPLSRGKVVEGALQCGYHGLRFGAAGACVFNPHGGGFIPSQAQVRSYTLAERYGVVWLWPGDAEVADPELIPAAFAFAAQPDRFGVEEGYLKVQANYTLIADNLLDLTHAPFVHPQFGAQGVSAVERLKSAETQLVRGGDTVTAMRRHVNKPPNQLFRRMFKVTAELVDSRLDMTWYPPALLYFDQGIAYPGLPEEEGVCLPSAHLLTPETEFSTHYFFAMGRNVFLDDVELGARYLEATNHAFRDQDEPMIEVQQEMMGATADLMSLGPVLLQTDAAPVAARRVLDRLIAREQGTVPVPADDAEG